MKIITTIIVAITSVASIYFVIKQNIEYAVLCLTLMFTFSNIYRYRDFMRQGYEKEAKWMRNLAIFFAIATVIVLYIIITK